MTPDARLAATIDILDDITAGQPAEKALTNWARRSRFAGSRDRAAIRDHVFDVQRRWRSCAALGGGETGRALVLGLLRGAGRDVDDVFSGAGYGPAPLTEAERAAGRPPADPAEAADMPDWLWPALVDAQGADARPIAEAMRNRAPLFLRVNLNRASVTEAATALAEEGIATRPHPLAATALEVTEGPRKVAGSRAFANGLVELQDAASQAICAALPLSDGMKVLDYCAGGGGKALAMGAAHRLEITAHDANPARMGDLPNRAERAGLRIATADRAALPGRGPFDLVLCDVPCSGSGAWRRAPGGKWLLTPARLEALAEIQDSILEEARMLVAPRGRLAYVTCSLLTRENDARVEAFVARHPDWQAERRLRFTPLDGGDGFFLAILGRAGQT
ncbi:RsmB/NOP family class I SAM-dependent RNA methyltransferase [Pseudooceanicola aestuarii]|uniref:RsmB/NOP family class I SAM-dependent RNA methyltransferase n=1 Tax=Pseudooceanicola aestuarii TaxID=2697319 RepID=UPI0013D18A9F|nr:RsmB/NOP family class I SAM-dependent RNA methyltransferase [Pseudooceanicola aestuarii]